MLPYHYIGNMIILAYCYPTGVNQHLAYSPLYQRYTFLFISMEYCIVYLSSSKGILSDDALTRILDHSQKNNRALGITGILLYFNGCIIQVLEGPEERVKALYDVIRRDPQHTQVIKLYSDPIEQRSFSDWSMGYKTLSACELDHLKQELSFMNDPFIPLPEDRQNNSILSLVEVFYKNNYRN